MSSSSDTNDNYTRSLYTNPQTAALELMPYFTAPWSVVGSGLILRSIWSGRHDPLQKSVYHRIMLGISVLDLISSLSFLVLGSWVVPESVPYTLYGVGTFKTCEIAGFFVNFLFGAMWYSCFLAIYFFLLVRCEWREETMARTLEPVAHTVSVLYPLTTGIYGLSQDLLNPVRPLPGVCWFTDYPPYCSDRNDAPDCIRGKHYDQSMIVTNSIILSFLLVVIVIAMVFIVRKVRHNEVKLRAYSIGENERLALSRTSETAWQSVLYIGSFFVLFFPMMMVGWLWKLNPSDPNHDTTAIFVFALLLLTFTPMQGFFNAYIYLHKRFWKMTAEGESFGFFRKIPLLGRWITHYSEKRNNSRHHKKNAAPVTQNTTICDNPKEQPFEVETVPPGGEVDHTLVQAADHS